MKVGGGGGEGRIPSFLPHPLPALLVEQFFARSLTLVLRSLLLNHTEMLATQSKTSLVTVSSEFRAGNKFKANER